MHSHSRLLTILAVVLLLAPVASAALAEDAPLPLTWMRFDEAKAGMEDDVSRRSLEVMTPALDELVRQGKVLDWGLAVPFHATGQAWTHVSWMTLPSWKALDEALPIMATKLAEGDSRVRTALRNQLVLENRRELILRQQAMPCPTKREGTKPHYVRFSWYDTVSADGDSWNRFYEDVAAATYARLGEEGQLTHCGLASEEVATQHDWTHLTWYMSETLDGLAAVGRAFDQQFAELPEEERAVTLGRIEALIAEDGYRAEILRLVHHSSWPRTVE